MSGLLLIAAMGVIHAVEAPEHFEFATYLGVLFLVNVLAAIIAMLGIIWDRLEAWLVGAVAAAGTFVAYVVSRTAGLPGLPEEERSEFLESLGILSVIVEAAFVVVFLVHARHTQRGTSLRTSG